MKYELIFKFFESNVFTTDLFLKSYEKFNPIITIQNKKWEFFLSEKVLKSTANEGFKIALNSKKYIYFEKNLEKFKKKIIEFKKTNISKISDKKFIEFLKKFKLFVIEFFNIYRQTEFFYFNKIEKELFNFIKIKDYSLEDVLSKKININSWPIEKRKLAEYVIFMQSLKFEYRILANEFFLGENSIFATIINQIFLRTNRKDCLSMTLEEIEKVLNHEKINDVFEREICSFIKWNKSKENLLILTKNKAKEKIKKLEKNIPKMELKGTPVSKGFVKGIVRVIPFSLGPKKYLNKFKHGEILVSTTTGPEMVVIMKKAKAIITDEGGLMSHAAVIAREFKIPCIVGTKYGTEIFKDGDLIEVDANKGIVKKI